MKDKKKAILIVLDGAGIGAMPDAALFGDEGSNTLRNVSLKKPLDIPNLEKMGLGNVEDLKGVGREKSPKAFFGKMMERSKGKDSTTGHWELAGIVTEKAFPTFPGGFPREIIDRFINDTGIKGILGNKAASGTLIIDELGEEHIKTGFPIVYTSADSVFQIAANKDVIPLDRLYAMSAKARKIADDYNIGRVIARPFVGNRLGEFKRTPERRDFSLIPPKPFLLSVMEDSGIPVRGVGKIDNLFADVGIPESIHTKDNTEGIKKIIEISSSMKEGFLFANLIDFDMLYGHRRDAEGFHRALGEFDRSLPGIIDTLDDDSILMITADHGTDPTTTSTDHSREYVPIIAYSKFNESGKSLGIRKSFADAGQTIAGYFSLPPLKNGLSFAEQIFGK